MILERHPELRQLSASEKLALVSELWDDLAAHPEKVPVTSEQIAELDGAWKNTAETRPKSRPGKRSKDAF